ncbi:hypothetical protein [Blastopirellula marina]|uniref:Uncharacterized protein n=1 Tax=Blastopirellula marina TaxID=124 RepID=A0A2S8F6L0_9BACT|nr:hypothetical protein [Blastopirellula marina]PQO27770.1 hypothetical protein C5Y98_27140 [Blastopirellula marina]PTL41510.1 hypothetical protein C5Y97_27155 [Blastopirellula marina]
MTLRLEVSMLLISLCAIVGCQPDISSPATSNPNNGGEAATAPDTGGASREPSEVVVTTPESQIGTTRLLSAEGTFNAPQHGYDNRFEFELSGQMKYRVQISFAPFVGDDWSLNPLTDVTNPTDSKMYAAFHAVFYNDTGQLVGCCQQDIEMEPNDGPTQLGSLVLRGPQKALLTATQFEIVIYESDKQIGSEPIDVNATTDLVGRSGKVITKLKEIDASEIATDNGTMLRLKAAITFEDPADKSRNTHLDVHGKAEYSLYLDTRHRPVTTMKSSGENETYERWEVAAEFDPRKRVPGVSAEPHFALYDDNGKLVACVGSPSVGQLVAPEDYLLSATELEMVAFETAQD